jgi:hypothetical protein
VLQTRVFASAPRVKWRAAAQAVAADLARLERADALKGQGAAAKAATDRSAWAAWLARYAARLRVEAAAGADGAARIASMNAVNPRYVLRNWYGLRLCSGGGGQRAGCAGPVLGCVCCVHKAESGTRSQTCLSSQGAGCAAGDVHQTAEACSDCIALCADSCAVQR